MDKNYLLERFVLNLKKDQKFTGQVYGHIGMDKFSPEVFSNPVEWNCMGTMRSLVFTSGIMGHCLEKNYV